jgi:hypothetical protein
VTANRFHRTKLCAAACALNAARNLNLKTARSRPYFLNRGQAVDASAALIPTSRDVELKTIDLQHGRGLLRGTKYEVER